MADPASPLSPEDKAKRDALIRKIIFGVVIVLALIFIVVVMAGGPSKERRPRGAAASAVEEPAWNLNDDASQKVTEFTRSASAGQEETRSQIEGLRREMELLRKSNDTLRQEVSSMRIKNETGGVANGDESIDRTEGLPTELHAFIPDVVKMLEREAVDRGALDPLPAVPQIRAFVAGRLPTWNEGTSPNAMERMARNCRVIPMRISDEQINAVAKLVAQRETERVNRDDIYAIGRMVWRSRAQLPSFTGGQLLKMSQLVSSASGAGTEATEATAIAPTLNDLTDPSAKLRIGHIFVPGGSAGWALRAITPRILERANLDPTTTGGAAAAATVMLQAARWSEYLRDHTLTDDHLAQWSANAVAVSQIAQVANSWDAENRPTSYRTAQGVAIAASLWDAIRDGQSTSNTQQRLRAARGTDLRRITAAVEQAKDPYEAILAGLATITPLPERVTVQSVARLWQTGRSDCDRAADLTQQATKDGAHPQAIKLAAGSWPTIALVNAAIPDAGGMSAEETFRRSVIYYAAQPVAAPVLRKAGNSYAALFAVVGEDWSWIDAAIASSLGTATAEALAADQHIMGTPYDPAVARVAASAAERASAPLAQMAVLVHVRREVRKMGADRDVLYVDKVIGYAEGMVERMVQPPLTAARLQAIARTVLRECTELFEGRRQLPNEISALQRREAAAAYEPAGVIAPRVVSMTRSPLAAAGARIVTIPAGSYGDAYLVTSAKPEITGSSQDVMIKLSHSWEGPNRIRLQMRDLYLIGEAKALPGAEAVEIRLKGLSYAFKSGRQFYTEIDGWVANVLDGGYGAVGTYHYNLDKFMKTQGAVALFEWTGMAVNNLTQQAVTQGANSVSTSTVTAGGTAVTASAQAAADAIRPQLAAIKATVESPNGQRIKVILKKPVPIPVPLSDWDTAVTAAPSSFGMR